MYLEGQANQRGYAMAAVLVAIALMSVVMTALLPAWRQQVQREKEAELAFRGEQYARAILLFRRKFNGASPPTIEALVDGRFLRKKFKDPITGDDFQLLYAGQQPGQQGQQGQQGRGGQAGQPPGAGVGIMGVISKSKDASIRIYRGAATYNAWNFVDPIGNRRGGPGQNPQTGGPGQGGRGPGGPGQGGRGPGSAPGPGTGPGGVGAPGRPGGGPAGGGRGPTFPGGPGGGGRGPVFPGGSGRGGLD